MQQKTKQPVQFELSPGTRRSVKDWIDATKLRSGDFLFPSRISAAPHLSTRQYARMVPSVVQWNRPGPDGIQHTYHASNETTKNLRAIQLLLGHTRLRVPYDISALKWMTHLRWPSRPMP